MTDLTKPTDLDGRVWAESGTITSPDTLDILDGWEVGEKPPAQFFNYWQNRTDKFLSYLMQKGIPEWDINTLFIANKSFVTQNGNVYLAKQTHSGQNPSLDITFVYWKLILGNTEVLYKPEVVTNVAALRLVSSAGVKNASTRGYYTAGDGGHAEYWYDAADVVTADNGITVIVGADGARWKLLVENKTINVLTAGIKGDSTTNNTTLFNTLTALGFDIQMPDGGYKVTDRIQLVNGQKLQGSGRTASYFVIDTDFNLSATGVIRLGTSEPGAEIYDVGFQFNQANQGVRASCTQYPPAIDGDAIPRFMVDRVRIEGAWDGISVIGNSGGCRIGFIEVGALNVGVDMDGSADFVHTGEWHFWPFGFTSKATLLNGVYYDNTTISARVGQMDGLNVGSIAMFRCYMHIKSNATTGIPNTFKTVKCDGDGARLLIEGGLNTIGSVYSTKSGASSGASVNCTGGITTFADYQQIGVNAVTDISVTGGTLRISGGTIAAYTPSVSTAIVSSGSLSVKNTTIRVDPSATYTQPMFAQSGTGELIFGDNEIDRKTSGSGDAVSFLTDVAGNYLSTVNLGGWGSVLYNSTLTAQDPLPLPTVGSIFNVSGNTNFASVTGGYKDREVTLFFSGTPTLTNSTSTSNSVALSSASSFASVANSTLTLRHNGVQWYEIGRSVYKKTESYGIAVIPTGQNYVTVSHGLASTPTLAVVSPSNVNIGVAAPHWCGSYTSTDFTINTAANVATDSQFAWIAKI